jgi:hypothetical protein
VERSPDATLRGAIEGLYATFAKYPRREHVEGCPCCVDNEDHARLYSAALRKLDQHDLETFAFKTMSTWGDTDDFRHFLPRMLELVATVPDWTAGDVMLGKLAYGKWLTWPADEQAAVVVFFDAVWADILSGFPHTFDAGSFLRTVAEACDDASRYLAAWRIAETLPAARHFARFVETHPIGWPAESPKAADQITAWLRDPARRAELEQAFFAFGADDKEAAAALSKAAETLKAI